MLQDAVQGATRPSQLVTWADADGAPFDLTGATVTGVIRNLTTGITRAVAGGITVTDAAAGGFRWDYASGDVADAGLFRVTFTATFSVAPTTAPSIGGAWLVRPST